MKNVAAAARSFRFIVFSLAITIGSAAPVARSAVGASRNRTAGQRAAASEGEADRGEGVLVSIPLGFFHSDAPGDPLPGVKYLRTFGVDFTKPKKNGLYQYADDARVEDFIRYTREHDLGVVWTLNVTSRTRETELAYVQNLLDRGMKIVALEYGGEFYLKKYAKADLSKKGVVERITPAIYLDLLDDWLPAFTEILPDPQCEHIIIGASHGSGASVRDRYRRGWNRRVAAGLKKRFSGDVDRLAWSFHLYAGADRAIEPKGEEDVVDVLDFGFLHDFPAGMRVYATESGYYVRDFSDAELEKAARFWTAVDAALRAEDVFGVHPLIAKGRRPSPLALYRRSGGLTPVGERFGAWLKGRTERTGGEAGAGRLSRPRP